MVLEAVYHRQHAGLDDGMLHFISTFDEKQDRPGQEYLSPLEFVGDGIVCLVPGIHR